MSIFLLLLLFLWKHCSNNADNLLFLELDDKRRRVYEAVRDADASQSR